MPGVTELSTELALVQALISTKLDQDDIRRLAERVGDWEHFLALLARHRVLSLAATRMPDGLTPSDIAQLMRQRAGQLARRTLMQAVEVSRLIRLFAAEQIPCLLLKGLPLSAMAHGDPLLRDCRDVDILVSPAMTRRAQELLQANGLRLVPERLEQLVRRYAYEAMFESPSGILIELKDRLHPISALQPAGTQDILDRRSSVTIADMKLPTMAPQDLLPYLCMHGARHCWFRLRWLADVAVMLSKLTEAELILLLDSAERDGVEVPLLEAISLAKDWLGLKIPESVRVRVKACKALSARRPLVERAVREMTPEGAPMESLGYRWAMYRAEYHLRPDLRYRLTVLERHLLLWSRQTLLRLWPSAGEAR